MVKDENICPMIQLPVPGPLYATPQCILYYYYYNIIIIIIIALCCL